GFVSVRVFRSGKTMRRMMRTGCLGLVLAATTLRVSPGLAQGSETVTLVFDHAIPNIDGKRMVAVVVTYPPGGKSTPHHHGQSAFIYTDVLSGAIRSQVDDDGRSDEFAKVLSFRASKIARYVSPSCLSHHHRSAGQARSVDAIGSDADRTGKGLLARHVGIDSSDCGGPGSTLPRPAAFNRQLQGHAEESPDNDNERQNEDVLQRRRHAHRTDDVAGN